MKLLFIFILLTSSVLCLYSQNRLSPEELDKLSYNEKLDMAEQGNIYIQLDFAYQNYQAKTPFYFQTAINWFKKAADLGSSEAQYMLGRMNQDGEGTTVDFNAALNWYKKAAEQGFAVAQAAMGNMYLSGKGTEKDLNKAYFWYSKAAEQNNTEAASYISLLEIIGNSDQDVLNSELIKAVENGETLSVQTLLDGKADVNTRNDEGGTVLMIAVDKRNVDLIKVLLEEGAEVNAIHSENFSTALVFASKKGYIEVARLLLSAGAEAESKEWYIPSALAEAEKAGHIELASLLKEGDNFARIEAPIAFSSASSFLMDTNRADRYSPNKVFDGDPLTSWVVASNDAGIGAYLDVSFSKKITIDAIEVMPGFFDERYWIKNNRIKYLKIWICGSEFGFPLKNEMNAQSFYINNHKLITLDKIRFEIVSIYEGEKWNDTCIAEIVFYRYGKKVEIVDGTALTGTEVPAYMNQP